VGKARIDLIPPEVIIELGKHYTYGANKYAPNNWRKGFPYSETFGSLTRHLYAWWAGESLDQESGHHHLIAVIWNAVTLMYFEMFPAQYGKFDDRVDNGGVPYNRIKVLTNDVVTTVPEGFRLKDPMETIKENDFTWDYAQQEWVDVPKARPFVGLVGSLPIICRGDKDERTK
jgi:hypothetical protein